MKVDRDNKSTVISFTGDLSFSAKLQNKYLEEDVIAPELLEFLNDSDACVINYESPITSYRDVVSKKTGIKRRLVHRSNPEVLDYLQKAFDNPVLSFANNHMNDMNDIGIIDTIDNAEASGIKYFGSGRNIDEAMKYVVIGDDIKVGIFSVEYKVLRKSMKKPFMGPLYDEMTEEIKQIISKVKDESDYTLMFYHGGTEFLHVAEPEKKKLIKSFLEMGCDAVVAHHPHVVQGYEEVGGKPVFYSLGNFLFDTDYQRIQEDTDKGLIVKLTFTPDGITSEVRGTFIDRTVEHVVPAEVPASYVDYGKVDYRSLWAEDKKALAVATERKERNLDNTAGAIFVEENMRIDRILKLMRKNTEIGDIKGMHDRLLLRRWQIRDRKEKEQVGLKDDNYYLAVLASYEANTSVEEMESKINYYHKYKNIAPMNFYQKGYHLLPEEKLNAIFKQKERSKGRHARIINNIAMATGKDHEWLEEDLKACGADINTYYFFGLYDLDDAVKAARQEEANKFYEIADAIKEKSLASNGYYEGIEADFGKYKEMLTSILSDARKDELRRRVADVCPEAISGIDEAALVIDLHAAFNLWGYIVDEYVMFDFAHQSLEERLQFVSTRDKNRVLDVTNPKDLCYLLDDKFESYKRLSDLFGRKVIKFTGENYNDLVELCAESNTFVKKTLNDSMGKGIEKVTFFSTDEDTLIEEVKAFADDEYENKGVFVAEECIEAHECIKVLNSSSVNSVRICTYNKDGDISAVDAFIKVGREGSFVDTSASGGLLVHIDEKTGILDSAAVDEKGFRYDVHPDNGFEFEGYQLPAWDDAVAVAIEAAKKVPELGYIGWDLAYASDEKWIIIEGNSRSQFFGQQAPQLAGIKEKFFKIVEGYDK